MIKLIIVEDEALAAGRLALLVHNYDPAIEVVAVLGTVEETVRYLKTKPHPDLMLMDIHLADGQSFEIFQQVHYYKPVIFTTAFDEFALEAFKVMSVDYIVKPVTSESLARSLNKYKAMAGSFLPDTQAQHFVPLPTTEYKKRFLGKIGQRLFFVTTAKVAYFRADNKIVHLVDREGHRYLIDATMERLGEQLDPKEFFRLNRTYIINIGAIKQIKPYLNNRLFVVAEGAQPDDEMVVSRERVAEFKEWAGG